MDQELFCNLKNCRKRLKEFAWVTSCSHIFCDEDGYQKFKISRQCPICETNLVDKFDFVHLPLNPNERLQTLSLCGFCPDVILDICSRAISFWVYQVHLEITYQEFLANKTKQRYKQLEASHDDENAKLQVEIACLEQQLEVIRNEITVQKDNVNELNDKLSETHRESQRLKSHLVKVVDFLKIYLDKLNLNHYRVSIAKNQHLMIEIFSQLLMNMAVFRSLNIHVAKRMIKLSKLGAAKNRYRG